MTEAAVIILLVAPIASALAAWQVRLRYAGRLLATAGSGTVLVAALAIAVRVQEQGAQSALDGWIFIDSLSVVILVLTAVVGFCAVLNSWSYMEHDLREGSLGRSDERRYFALVLVFIGTMVAVPVLNNLGVMWVAIEATTVVSVLLVSSYRTGPALEAAWKYLVIGSVGIALALFGTMMTYYASSHLGGDDLSWTGLLTVAKDLDPDVMRLAFVFVLVGYGTKVGLAPMHTWLPDAHSQAPSPVSALLSGVLLNCALYAILRFRVLTAASAGDAYPDDLLIAFGLFSVGLAVPFLVVQHDIKRMLAYHSVEHMGIIALAAGIGGPVGLYAAMLHLVAHSLTKSSLFMAAGSAVQFFNTRSMHRMRGVLALAPFSGAGLILGALALAGLPPFAMFTSEYGLVTGSFARGHALVGVVGIVLIALAAASLLYHTVQVVYKEPGARARARDFAASGALSIAIPLALLVWISVAPPDRFEQALDQAVGVLEAR
jgi:hydrogenase-4 component F